LDHNTDITLLVMSKTWTAVMISAGLNWHECSDLNHSSSVMCSEIYWISLEVEVIQTH
jgi:hypothetical protein